MPKKVYNYKKKGDYKRYVKSRQPAMYRSRTGWQYSKSKYDSAYKPRKAKKKNKS